MPIYEYQCDDCGRISEVLKKGFEDTVETCESCGGQARRIMSNTSFVLKGTGWYVTDYCGKNASTGGGNGNGEGAKKSEGSESASPASPASPAPKAETAAASSSNGGSKPAGTATTCAG